MRNGQSACGLYAFKGVHTLFTSQRERDRENEIEVKGEGERER